MKKANLILGCLIISAFIPFVSYSQVTDIDGNVYKTVEIGTQTWMAENLRTTKYNDSTSIPLVSDSIAWITMTSPAYCWYKNDSASYKATYGALYNGYAVSTEKLCPTGWHVPSSSEWKTMMREFLGGDANLSTISGGDSLAGYKLKESGSVHWKNQNPRTTNETGFTFLPGGKRLSSMNNNKGAFNALGSFGYMWSSTEMNEQYGCFWGMYNHNGYVGNGSDTDRKDLGISVRCIKDLPDTGPKIRMIKIKR